MSQHCTVFSNQGDINLTFRDDYLFFVSAFADKNRGTDIFTEVGDGIDCFLYGEEITATVLRRYLIVMTDIFCQFGDFPADSINSQACDGSCSVDIQVGIVFTAFRKSGNLIGFDEHEEFL